MWKLLLFGIGLTAAQFVTDDGIAVCQPDDQYVTMHFYLTVLNISCLSLICLVLIINIHKKMNAPPKSAKDPSMDSFDMGLYGKSQTQSIYPMSEAGTYYADSVGRQVMARPESDVQLPPIERVTSTFSALQSQQALPAMQEDNFVMDPHYIRAGLRTFSQSVDHSLYEIPKKGRKVSVPSMMQPSLYGNVE